MDEAYLKAFPTDNRRYAFSRAKKLIKTERVNTAMKEELKPICEELGIDSKSVLQDIQHASKHSEKEDVRLRALFKLADILDLEDKNETKVTQVTGALFQGFTPDELGEAERPKEITDGSSDSKKNSK
jgi:alkylhydroperoxidase/carboxymuconolactone decarboxylase family protein YurZ